MIAYIFSFLLLAGFFYMFYRNSPKHAYMFLGMIAICVGIFYINPGNKFTTLGSLAFGIVGLFTIAILSRRVREDAIQKWFAENGFKVIPFPGTKDLFAGQLIGTNDYYAYSGELANGQKKLPFILGVSYHSHRSGNTSTIEFHCAYYFNTNTATAMLEQKFLHAKDNTPGTNFARSQFGYFDLKKCDIIKPAMGGIAVRWRVPHTVKGYSERYEWIKNALNN
ncbi:MAG: hypothetical protein V4722_18705 [Bacteroidota bacterium]